MRRNALEMSQVAEGHEGSFESAETIESITESISEDIEFGKADHGVNFAGE